MELTLEQAALAWAQGKRVEAEPIDEGIRSGWKLVDSPAERDGYYTATVFAHPVEHRFRLAPEPPAKKWRPWSMLEVPVGVLLKQKQANFKAVLIEFDGNDRIVAGRERVMSRNGCFENYKHSLDGGKTWLPCGVEVDA